LLRWRWGRSFTRYDSCTASFLGAADKSENR
jgi:hypothetical protein